MEDVRILQLSSLVQLSKLLVGLDIRDHEELGEELVDFVNAETALDNVAQ